MNLYGISGEIFLAISGMIALLISVFSSKDSSLKITTRFYREVETVNNKYNLIKIM